MKNINKKRLYNVYYMYSAQPVEYLMHVWDYFGPVQVS